MKLFGRHLKHPQKAQLPLAVDAFSDGQIKSKLWLCRELEKVVSQSSTLKSKPLNVWVFAGWQGLLPFLIFSREQLAIENLRLFDLDPDAVASSLKVNDSFHYAGKYSALVQDVNLSFSGLDHFKPDIVINTSCEHFASQRWWANIPGGALVVLQSTDMSHSEHINSTTSSLDLQRRYGPWEDVLVSDELHFNYGSFSFARHLVIGIKGLSN